MRGEPDEEEIAALAVVLASLAGAAAGAGAEAPRGPRSAWADPARRLRAALHPGPGAWRGSAGPH